ncbi:MAG: hypothetical protein NVSMB51_22580 [Solirubrobacteraceae bacterium]
MRRAALLAALVVLAGCGSSPRRAAPPALPLVAALGDSITAGSPNWDPDPSVRARIGAQLDERSQFEYWAAPRLHVRFRNCGVFGERTDQIALRLRACAAGARYLLLQGGINDIAQGVPAPQAARNLESMVGTARGLGLKVELVQVLPWNNGYPAAAQPIRTLNTLISRLGQRSGVPVLPFYRALEDPGAPGRMRAALTVEGDHPSVAGYRLIGGLIELPH